MRMAYNMPLKRVVTHGRKKSDFTQMKALLSMALMIKAHMRSGSMVVILS